MASETTDALVQILAEHPIIDWSDGTFTCGGCAERGGDSGGHKGWTPDEANAHLAEVLAAYVRTKQAEAWDEGHKQGESDESDWHGTVINPTREPNPYREGAES